ncbi:MAG: nucleotidyltransferase domain-containing protein [Armatimonadetes bacterium]|nr:nucleotidyltransferase domain-containing protein [Anaerolineae bacterium]
MSTLQNIESLKSPPTLEALRARRDDILALAAQYGAYNVRVFGSVARGDATHDSDVDLLVQFHAWVSLYELAGIKRALETALNLSVDIIEDHPGLRDRFRRQVLKDAQPL